MIFRLFLVLTILSASAFADSWQCRNDLEIRCADGKCAAETKDGFTPMSVSFDDSGSMNVCAYSGCWEGTGKVFSIADFLTVAGQNLKFSTSPNDAKMGQNISITIDRKDNVATLKAGSFAQPLICEKKTTKSNTPEFSDYKVSVTKAKPKPIVFTGNREARMFRTRLRQANLGAVNFAGRYIFTYWGCGTGCVYGAIINTRTGVVYFPEETAGIAFGMNIPDEPLQYRKDSKLFILHGNAGNSEKAGVSYLVWEGTKFRQVNFVPTRIDSP